jgi:hypothetical protein
LGWFLRITGTDIVLLSVFSIGIPATVVAYAIGMFVMIMFAEILGDMDEFVFTKAYKYFMHKAKWIFVYVLYLLITKSQSNEFFSFIYCGILIPTYSLTSAFGFACFLKKGNAKKVILKSAMILIGIIFTPATIFLIKWGISYLRIKTGYF